MTHAESAAARDLRDQLLAQGYAWHHAEVIASVVAECLDNATDALRDVPDIDNWQQE